MGSKRSLVLLCCIALFLVAAPRLPYFDGGKETLFSLLWLIGLVLHMAANMRHMKKIYLGKRKQEIERRFRIRQWQRAHSVTH